MPPDDQPAGSGPVRRRAGRRGAALPGLRGFEARCARILNHRDADSGAVSGQYSRGVTGSEELLAGKTVAVLGGTGPQGRALARRWARAGVPVVIGSRSAERASETAAALAEATGGDVRGADNAAAAQAGDIVLVAVPWDGHAALLVELADALAGRVVVDCVNPLGFDKQGAFALSVAEGSADPAGRRAAPGLAPWSARSTTSARCCWRTTR